MGRVYTCVRLSEQRKITAPEVARIFATREGKKVVYELATSRWYQYEHENTGIWAMISELQLRMCVVNFLDHESNHEDFFPAFSGTNAAISDADRNVQW
jgi:hypothetical protein